MNWNNYFKNKTPAKMTEKGKRHTNVVNDLTDEIIKRRIKLGQSRLTVMDWLIKEKGYSKSRAYDYLQMSDKEINERSVKNFGDDLKFDIERFEMLYEEAKAVGNEKEARECLKEIAKLKGHYVERIETTQVVFKAKFGKQDEKRDNTSGSI